MVNKNKSEKETLNGLFNEKLEPTVDNLLTQYKLLVETTNEISNRRENTNKFYLTLITIFVGVLTFISTNYGFLFVIIPLIFIILVSASWKKHIQQYKLLNTIKFSLIIQLEKNLPVYAFTKEWELLTAKGYSELSKWDEKVPTYLIWFSVIIIIIIVMLELYYYWFSGG